MKRLLLLLSAFALACAGAPTTTPGNRCQGPAWACEFGGGECPLPEFKGKLCAVGNDISKNRMVARRSAETSARGAMQRLLAARITSWNERVVGTLTDSQREEFNQKVGQVDADKIVDAVQSGVMIPKVYDGGETYYALAMFDPKALGDTLNGLEKVQTLSAEVRERVKNETDRVMAEFERATASDRQ
jgi:hypothetical protein